MFEAHEKKQREQYAKLYNDKVCHSTGNWRDVAEFIMAVIPKSYRILDIGCGKGLGVSLMRDNKFLAGGMDVTLAAVDKARMTGKNSFTEAPAWAIPFADRYFDFTFSSDVMEHLPPETVEASIKEIYRVTRVHTLHIIAETENTHYLNSHLTVHPITWWVEEFAKHNKDRTTTHLMTHDMMWILHEFICRRGHR